jgi:hypothetical protein
MQSNTVPQKRWLDCLLAASCIVLVYFSRDAGIVDMAYSIVYVTLVLLLRSCSFRRPLDISFLLIHLAITDSLLGSFDKVHGYNGDSPEFLTGLYAISIIGFTFWSAFRYKTTKPALALIFLFIPIGGLPLEIGRNVIARIMFKDIPELYVTKIAPPHIYGASLHNTWAITRFTKINGTYRQDFVTDTYGLGSGSMDAQFTNIGFPALQLVKWLYASGKTPGEHPAIDNPRNEELIKQLTNNFAQFDTLRKRLEEDHRQHKAVDTLYIPPDRSRIDDSCNWHWSANSCQKLSTKEKNAYWDMLNSLGISFVEFDDSGTRIYFETGFLLDKNDLYLLQHGLVYSASPKPNNNGRAQEWKNIRDGWYIYDKVN